MVRPRPFGPDLSLKRLVLIYVKMPARCLGNPAAEPGVVSTTLPLF
jgi:hypothetical protein